MLQHITPFHAIQKPARHSLSALSGRVDSQFGLQPSLAPLFACLQQIQGG